MVATAPAETQSSASPSALWEALTWLRMSGMRTTQAAKRKPSTAKKAVSASRAVPQGVSDAPGVLRDWEDGRSIRSWARILFRSGTK